jgi:hypothetical protein
MMMEATVKIPQELLIKVNEDFIKIPCLRNETVFQYFADSGWKYYHCCGGYGNGYGVGMSCADNCPLRITDLDKCRKVGEKYKYLVQDDYYDDKS